MQDAIVAVPQAPKTTMSVDSQVYIGQNQIRRNVGRTTTLYTGDRVVDQTRDLLPGASFTIDESVALGAFTLFCDNPITLTLDGTVVLKIKKMIMFDPEDIGVFVIMNTSTNTNRIRVTYLV